MTSRFFELLLLAIGPFSSRYFGRFAPYFDREFRRVSTPDASSTPLMT